MAAVVISDDDETDLPIDTPQAASTPKVEPAWNQKRPLEDRSPCSSPPKKGATEEEEGSTPPREAVLPRGVDEPPLSGNHQGRHPDASEELQIGTRSHRPDLAVSYGTGCHF